MEHCLQYPVPQAVAEGMAQTGRIPEAQALVVRYRQHHMKCGAKMAEVVEEALTIRQMEPQEVVVGPHRPALAEERQAEVPPLITKAPMQRVEPEAVGPVVTPMPRAAIILAQAVEQEIRAALARHMEVVAAHPAEQELAELCG